jgi:tetratricopeptide (TPR) repeat protein
MRKKNNEIEEDNETWFKQGVEQHRLGKMQEAKECFDRALEIYPQNIHAFIMRAVVKKYLEDFGGALRDLDKAIEINSKRPESYINRGNLKLEIRDYKGAIEDYEKYQECSEPALKENVSMVLNLAKEKLKRPVVFLSYSWDNDSHISWVLKLASRLLENGVEVLFDKWEINNFGKPLPNFMEQSITKAQRVICVMTPNYKKKTDKLIGGVGYEYSIITSEIFTNIGTVKFIPILRSGDELDAIPVALRGRYYCDMRDDEKFNEKYFDLLKDIFKIPKYKKPRVGKKPDEIK